MGYRGKLAEREKARELRAQGMTMPDIAAALGVSKSSVSLWTRDVEFEPQHRRTGARRRGPNALQRRKAAEIAAMNDRGLERMGSLSDEAFLAAGAALYAGEGSKTDGEVLFANSDAQQVLFFIRWLRHFFDIDESRLRIRLYLHEGLDLDAAVAFWSSLTRIPATQFHKPYRAVADVGIRNNKHLHGCVGVRYACTRTHREVMGLVRALLTYESHSGVAQSAAQGTVNAKVLGSSPSPGAPATRACSSVVRAGDS